jgi:uncharacterized protein
MVCPDREVRRLPLKMPDTQIIVFVKAPREGAVKTRLARAVGDPAARDIYTTLVSNVLNTLRRFPRVQLRFSPDDAFDEIRSWLEPTWEARPQGPGDLGARLFRAFSNAFTAGAAKTIIIGSDCPELTMDDLEEAAGALDTHDLVLGPATDGGYWLIGLTMPEKSLFEGISWSTENVLSQTVSLANAMDLRVHRLRTLSDIDTLDDWHGYMARTEAARDSNVASSCAD